MKGWAPSAALAALATALTLLVVEGTASVLRGSRPGWSLAYRGYERIVERLRPETDEQEIFGDGPGVITRASIFEELSSELQRNGVGIGNTPFDDLVTEAASMNYRDGGCLRQKPNLDKTEAFLRTLLFDALNPPLAFWDTQRALSPRVAAFLEARRSRQVRHRSNEHGERITLPEVAREQLALVAGDSVALGVGVMDEETLASRLQVLDPSVAYVNLGVGGAEAADVVCNLEAARRRYAGRIAKLVYVYCENDFDEDERYGRPEDLVAWLAGFVREEQIGEVTLVFAPYVFNVFPEVTRIPGQRGWDHPYRTSEKQRLRAEVLRAGFRWLDIAEIGHEEVSIGGSLFAGLSLFVDIVHPSPRGTLLVAERIASGALAPTAKL